MKVHYINILLFAFPLNILLYNQRNHKSTTHHTQTNRSLCECELYAPDNYDNDPQMKKVMQQFEDRTSQRFHEYDDRMKTMRQKCKDKCDKESQKIILKDKLEKQMEEQLTTLEAKIDTDDIATCICEKSIADKVEKGCLQCTQNLGGIVAPSSGVLLGIAEGALYAWKPAAITAAKAAALTEAKDLATKAGIDAVVTVINRMSHTYSQQEIARFISIVNKSTYDNAARLFATVKKVFGKGCTPDGGGKTSDFCRYMVCFSDENTFKFYVKPGIDAYNVEFALQKEALEATKVGAVNTGFEISISSINAAIIAIVVIILIMIIIYLILRYRRKKKMKKKLQYIKLLEE
ncbi:rifin [Plasmodium reichenowi]|uniref:Rifin n=1 Tax=Plasmodium reichenowi TaxID=5854 RepID=A0A060RLV5_PLARE|nr:rifin [Plasmodium reichenowi]